MLEFVPRRREGLNARMNRYREVWMRRMLDREMRMVDMQIMAALQNGTAFFASTSLLAIGGALTVLRSTDEMLHVVAVLPIGIQTTPRAVGAEGDRPRGDLRLCVLQVRLVVPAVTTTWRSCSARRRRRTRRTPPEAEAHVLRTSRLFTAAGRHFNHGQRAFFFALGYLGWFISP